MKKCVDMVDYLAGVSAFNAMALQKYKCRTKEGRAYLDSWGDQLKTQTLYLAQLRKELMRAQRAAARLARLPKATARRRKQA